MLEVFLLYFTLQSLQLCYFLVLECDVAKEFTNDFRFPCETRHEQRHIYSTNLYRKEIKCSMDCQESASYVFISSTPPKSLYFFHVNQCGG